MSALALAVLLSLVSAVAYAGGAIVQERVAAGSPGVPFAPLRSAGWWVAVGLNGLGALLHVVALAYGPLSLVQPLGALTIVFALPMAALFVGRRAGRRAWQGALLATAGLAGLLAMTGGSASQPLTGSERGLLTWVTASGVAALFLLAHLVRGATSRSVLLAAAAGAAFGIASVFTKAAAGSWRPADPLAGLGDLVVIAVLASAGLLLSQAAYRGAGLTVPLATVTVVNPVVAATVGLTLFGESFRFGAGGTAVALVSGALAAAGIVLLTAERLSAGSAPEPVSVGAGSAGRGRPAVRTAGSAAPVDRGAGRPGLRPAGAAPARAAAARPTVPAEVVSGVLVSAGPAALPSSVLPVRPAVRPGAASDRHAAAPQVRERVDV
ncbi:DMT family transporter [Streptomyces sp. NPDC097619]|uniref:DMT family transporter n=1 Tax=Streptomyces sp. NPDC097619 TaxID=3157228 RepID=UPI0033178F81